MSIHDELRQQRVRSQELVAAGALSADQLGDQLGHPKETIGQAISSLAEQGWVRRLVTEYEQGSGIAYYKLAPEGEAALERWLLEGHAEPERMTVYVGM